MIRIVLLATMAFQGADAHWSTAAKNGFGTSTSLNSKVWFTLANGVMTEVFYPTLDVPNVQMLQLQVVMGGKLESEIDDTIHRLELPNPNSLTFRQVNTAKSGQYTITKTYVTDYLVYAHARAGNWEGAQKLCDEAIADKSAFGSCWGMMAAAATDAGRKKQAAAHVARAAKRIDEISDAEAKADALSSLIVSAVLGIERYSYKPALEDLW